MSHKNCYVTNRNSDTTSSMATYDEMLRGDRALADMQRESQASQPQDHPGPVSVEPEGSPAKFREKIKVCLACGRSDCQFAKEDESEFESSREAAG